MRKILILIFIFNSCSYPEMIRNEIIYSNDFENNDLVNIDGGGLSNFNSSTVLGDFNNDGFTLHLENVGEHEYIFISLDLYIHGSWDGNFNGFSENDKPDKWTIEFKPDMNLYRDPASNFFTFNQYAYFPCSGYDTDEESLLNNQEPLQLMIISFLLVTLMIQGYYCNDTKD